MTLIEHVREAFANALENGEDFAGWSDEQVAIDMATYDADIEGFDLAAIKQAVASVRSEATGGK